MLFPRDKDTGRPGWIARNLCQGWVIFQEQTVGAPQCMQEHRRRSKEGDPLPVEARGPVVPPGSIEQPVERRYAQAAPPGAHGHLGLPGVGDGVVGLHRGQIRGPVVAV